MKLLLTLTALLIGAWTATASADPELDRLRAAYEAAVERATQPLRESYERELKRILDARTRSGNLEEALAAREELERLADEAGAADPQTTASSGRERFFVNTTWKTPTGTFFHFLPEGKGIRFRSEGRDQTEFTWQMDQRGIVEWTGEANRGGPVTSLFFRFAGRTRAHYGSERERISTELEKDESTPVPD